MAEINPLPPPEPLPRHAQVVIIGGGVIGCSVAYHLTQLGWRDVLLLERAQLTAGTTWHAAGLVVCGGFFTETSVEMARYTRDLYNRLEAETGQSTGFKPVGYIELACTPGQYEQLRRTSNFVRGYGVNSLEISPAEVKALWPLARVDDVIAGFYTAEDGRANPVDVTMALAKGARMGGARIAEGTRVIGIQKQNGRVTGVLTDRGPVAAEYVVNCAGMWGREVGKMAGVDVPLHAAEHYYLITEPIEGMHPNLPIIEDLSHYAYYREEVGGLMLGLFEPIAAPWGMDGIPENFSFGEIQPDWERMAPYVEAAMSRIPGLENVGIHKFFCGPESFTADLAAMMGQAPELDHFYVAAGFNSLGILLGGGAGRILAQWIVDGLPPVDIGEFDIARALPFHNTPQYLYDRTVEILGTMYKVHWPNEQMETGRNVRRSVLHDQLTRAGAWWGESAGWEYAEWFAPPGVAPHVEYSWGRQNWFEYQAAEHRAAREAVVLMDLSLMSKFLVQGRDAEQVLNHICSQDVAVPVGRCVYTTWLNERGGIEADLTVTRLAEERFLVVTSDAVHRRVEAWLRRHIHADAHVTVTDVTSAYTLLSLQGPQSRALLGHLSHADLSNEAFPYLTMREIDLRYAPVVALRVSYVGELGYELYIPTEFAPGVYEALVEAGAGLGLRHAGLQALNSLRLEKAYREYGHDVDNTDTPLEAGLGFTVDFDKPGGFVGREALLRQRENGPLTRRMLQFLLRDPQPLLYYGEPIYRNGKRVGYLSSGSYGFTLGAAVGMGFVADEEPITSDYVRNGQFEIEVVDQRCAAQASLHPLFDPHGEHVRS